MNNRVSLRTPLLVAVTVIAAWSTLFAFAINTPSDEDNDKQVAISTSIVMTEALPGFQLIEAASEKSLSLYNMQDFFARYSDDWQVGWDDKSGRPNIVSGPGIAIMPGHGNKLTMADLGLADKQALTVDDVAGLLRGFIDQEQKMFQISNDELTIDRDRSLAYGKNRHFWSIELQQTYQGVPVEGAHVFFRINNGNLVQFGANRVGDVSLDAVPTVPREKALEMGLSVGKVLRGDVEFTDLGTLKIVPVQDPSEIGQKYLGPFALGYEHVLVWEFAFLGSDDHGYRMRVDAHSGEVLELIDRTVFAEVKANVYPVTNTDPLVSVGLPFASVSNGTTKVTDNSGNYFYSGGTATVNLNGRYTRINDNCGSISLSNSTNGNLDFAGAGGTDCTTPGFGGSGNTHSARTGFYHLTNINRTAASFLPGNSWLNGTLTANMNINQNCNAFWNGSTVNFYTSGGGCANTGEIAAVFLHEWGHGMDSNAGGSSSENGTGEAVGDSFAFIELREPCIGENFLSSACYNCNSSCTGVRDVSAYAIGGVSTIARPSNVETNSGMDCDRLIGFGNTDCPYIHPTARVPYQGPMGYEGHCESYIASSANWDLAQSLVSELGTEGGWNKMEELWYGIMTPMGSAYQVASGGQCNPSANVNGCGANNWYTLYLAADDDDGNLSNGTPNGCRIWDAFDAHGIACGSRPACSSTCTPTAVANAGADQTISEGASVVIGTAAQSGHTYSWSPGGSTAAQPTVSPTTTTTYTVTATTSCGSAQDSVTVTVNPAGSNGPQDAVYNSGLGAPACSVAGSECDSLALLDGRATKGPEPNQPNTLDSCTDGNSGTYHSDESIDKIVVSTLDNGNFSVGDTVKVDVTVYAYQTGSSDTLDLYYAADANNPSWVLIGSTGAPGGGTQTISANYTLPSGNLQAVRANFRYQGSASTCGSGNYDDTDDLVFAVEGGAVNTAPSVSISAPSNGSTSTQGASVSFSGSATDTQDGNLSSSLSWTSSLDGSIGSGASFASTGLSVGTHTITASVSDSGGLSDSATVSITVNAGGAVAQTATFDSGLQAPQCSVVGISCTSAGLLDGRGTKGPEPNQPNTIADSCADGGSGTYHSDESIDALKVSTTDGTAFAAGKTVTIEATVYAYSTFSADHLDLYYAADANSPSWVFIGTLDPTTGGTQTLSTTYTLPSGSLQAIRGNFRYQGSASSCSTGNYDDHDDLVFAVN